MAPFRWTGANTVAARTNAQAAVRGHLRLLRQQHEQARHFIVAHSHGGNVALYALRDESLLTSIAGVACLATPFLVCRPRSLGSMSVLGHVAGVVGVMLLVLMFVARWTLSGWEARWLAEGTLYSCCSSACSWLPSC